VNVLDENIPKSQRLLLESWRHHIQQIGVNTGRIGMTDDEIIPLLLRARRPTFFTRDDDFYDRGLCHERYGLVYLAVQKYEVAAFVRRFLHHREFNTQAKRMGTVVRVSHARMTCWRIHAAKASQFAW
jgi:hypothetical protein